MEFLRRSVPKEHSTIRLYGLVADALDMELDQDILIDLDDLYIDARYPGELGLLPYGRPTLDDARQFYQFAAEVYRKVQRGLAEESGTADR